MSDDDVQERKRALRAEARGWTAALSGEERRARSSTACARLAQTREFAAARTVMLFLSAAGEVDTSGLALRCWQAGKLVCVPRVVSWNEARMLPVEITSLGDEQVAPVGHGFREPLAGRPVPIGSIDLAIVPGLAFTAAGARLGRGRAFYDKFLALTEWAGASCGLCYERQVIAEVPVEPHDVALNLLVTDDGVRRFGR